MCQETEPDAWICSSCTFKNNSLCSRCEMCQAPSGVEVKGAERMDDYERQNATVAMDELQAAKRNAQIEVQAAAEAKRKLEEQRRAIHQAEVDRKIAEFNRKALEAEQEAAEIERTAAERMAEAKRKADEVGEAARKLAEQRVETQRRIATAEQAAQQRIAAAEQAAAEAERKATEAAQKAEVQRKTAEHKAKVEADRKLAESLVDSQHQAEADRKLEAQRRIAAAAQAAEEAERNAAREIARFFEPEPKTEAQRQSSERVLAACPEPIHTSEAEQKAAAQADGSCQLSSRGSGIAQIDAVPTTFDQEFPISGDAFSMWLQGKGNVFMQYLPILQNHGWDDVRTLSQMSADEIDSVIAKIGMPVGHGRAFKRALQA